MRMAAKHMEKRRERKGKRIKRSEQEQQGGEMREGRREEREEGGKKTEEILSGFTCAENAPNIGARKYKKRPQNDYSSDPLFKNCCFHIHFVVWSNSTGCHSWFVRIESKPFSLEKHHFKNKRRWAAIDDWLWQSEPWNAESEGDCYRRCVYGISLPVIIYSSPWPFVFKIDHF